MPRTNALKLVRDAHIDLETRVDDDHHQALKLWLRLLTCTNKIETDIRSKLRTDFDTTLPRFDLMAQLERNPDGLKMNQLSQRLMVTGGNVTGITDQLEKEGLVVRKPDPNDRRINSVTLTPAGRRSFHKMARAHEQWVVHLFAGLTANDKDQIYQILAKLKRHVSAMDDALPGGQGSRN